MYNFGPINQITNNKLNKNKVDKVDYNNKVSELENNINQKVNQTDYENNKNNLQNQINNEISQRTSKDSDLQTQINNLVLSGGGDSNPEVIQARSNEATLNDRLTGIENRRRTFLQGTSLIKEVKEFFSATYNNANINYTLGSELKNLTIPKDDVLILNIPIESLSYKNIFIKLKTNVITDAQDIIHIAYGKLGINITGSTLPYDNLKRVGTNYSFYYEGIEYTEDYPTIRVYFDARNLSEDLFIESATVSEGNFLDLSFIDSAENRIDSAENRIDSAENRIDLSNNIFNLYNDIYSAYLGNMYTNRLNVNFITNSLVKIKSGGYFFITFPLSFFDLNKDIYLKILNGDKNYFQGVGLLKNNYSVKILQFTNIDDFALILKIDKDLFDTFDTFNIRLDLRKSELDYTFDLKNIYISQYGFNINPEIKLNRNLFLDPYCQHREWLNYNAYAFFTQVSQENDGILISQIDYPSSESTSFMAVGWDVKLEDLNLQKSIDYLFKPIIEVIEDYGVNPIYEETIKVIFLNDLKTEISRVSDKYTKDFVTFNIPEECVYIRFRLDIPVYMSYSSGLSILIKEVLLYKKNDYKKDVGFIYSDETLNYYINNSLDDIKTRLDDLEESTDSKKNNLYISPTGNDNNIGDYNNPLLTINKALQLGASNIYILSGIYEQNINLSNAKNRNVNIISYQVNQRPCFISPDSLITSQEEKVNGYTKVYKSTINKTFSQQNIWIFQDNVIEETTLISDEERHPLERGQKYRCYDTKIEKCSQTTLTEALTQIDSSDNYLWFLDSNSNTLYFSRPQEITSTNPLRGSFGTSFFSGGNRNISLNISGIEIKYMRFNIDNTSLSKIVDCKTSNVYAGGAFTYDRSLGSTFLRCEASRCYNGSNGDGFNGHSYNSGDINSKQTTISLIDCWSHDNNDDGYSDHERSEITIIGGLYEYNKKGGITPSYGSHCTCYDVYSRKNYAGFYYTGIATEAEGGEHGQMICYNCVSEGHTIGGTRSGYRVDGTGNKMILINCKSLNNTTGFANGDSSNEAILIDCGTYNDTTIKNSNGIFTIKNTTIVT